HWVSAKHAVDATVRVYDRLFTRRRPDDGKEGKDFKEYLNPESLSVLEGCKLEGSVAGTAPGSHFQFERTGYFVTDAKDSTPEHLVFNRTVTLRDTWAKIEKENQEADK
ncbi:MAG: hypothetical protein AB8B96_08310, partial [Lysobacterales bacterium]